jgi:predicted small secreted protein
LVVEFKKINSQDEITKIINSAFGVDIEISGSWGYSQDDFSDISKIKKDIKSTQNMISTMRANIEMNMTLSEDERYGSINLHEISSKKDGLFEKIEYEISAMKESDYKVFIQDYKDNFDNNNFDLEGHFNKRKKATIKRKVIHWFKIK